MPLRKSVTSLENLAINKLEVVIETVILRSAEYISEHYYRDKISHVSISELDDVISDLQELVLVLSPHYLHHKIVDLTVKTLTHLHQDNRQPSRLAPCSQAQDNRRRSLLWRQVLGRWSSLLCCDAVTSLTLDPASDLGLVTSICDLLPDMTRLRSLHIQPWSCVKHNLLHSHEDFSLMFLPNLQSLSVTDIDMDIITSISTFCPELTHLDISDSEVTDEAAAQLCRLRRLARLSLTRVRAISSYGWATLLARLPQLSSLGRCDCLPEALGHLDRHVSHVTRSRDQLSLGHVECEAPIMESDLERITSLCPDLGHVRLVYRPQEADTERLRGHEEDNTWPHLTKLKRLTSLSELSLVSADFYNHSLFSAIKGLGPRRLTKLELEDCDEMNVNSLLIIGDSCPRLSSLTLSGCHFNVDSEERARISEICSLQTQSKALFRNLREVNFKFSSPVHLIMMKLPLHFAHNLSSFSLDLLDQPLDDSFITTLMSWSAWQSLASFKVTNCPGLGLMSANSVIGACPRIQVLGALSSWGLIDNIQLSSFIKEIRSRNYDIRIDR